MATSSIAQPVSSKDSPFGATNIGTGDNALYYGGTGIMGQSVSGPLQSNVAFQDLQTRVAAMNPTGAVNIMPTVAGMSQTQANQIYGAQNKGGIVPDYVAGNSPAGVAPPPLPGATKPTVPGVFGPSAPGAPAGAQTGTVPQGGQPAGTPTDQGQIPYGGTDSYAIHSTNAAEGVNQAILDFQSSTGLLAGQTPDAIIAALPTVTADQFNALTPDEQAQATRIFQLAGIPLPTGANATKAATTTPPATTTPSTTADQITPLQQQILDYYMKGGSGATMSQPLGVQST